ncbi:hypothetical protein [Corynebacterium sp. HMSC074C01]|uniref:Mu transposase domain-containing protein n=1 Tax=Corynebacterium sp. HMSC074C01 TaxID=1739482 RepID=UPI00352A24EC
MLFDEFERGVLGELPTTPWQHTEWKRAKVAPNFHITVNTARYSVPYQLVGRTVDVRITGNEVTVLMPGSVLQPTGLPKPGGSMSPMWIIFLPTWLIPQGCGPVSTSTVKQPRSGPQPGQSSKNSSAQRQSLPRHFSRAETGPGPRKVDTMGW